MIPRYTSRPLPTTSYLPGVSPRGDRPPERSEPTADEGFAYGVDLFNHGFPWEAHEVWEGLWRPLPRDTSECALLQGLIHLAAACVKARSGVPAKARDFIASGCGYLERAGAPHRLDVGTVIAAAAAWAADVTAPPPCLVLVTR